MSSARPSGPSTVRPPRCRRRRSLTTANLDAASNASPGSRSARCNATTPRTTAGSSMSGRSMDRPTRPSSRTPVPTQRTRVRYAFAGSASPGPNNTLLWASGMRFGFRAAVPHVVGTALGIGTLLIASDAGLGALLDAVPAAEIVLKVAGSLYLVVIAYLVLGGGRVGRAEVSRPLNLPQAAGFQFVNPKAWIFAIAIVGTFFPVEAHPFRVAALTCSLMVVVAVSSSMWAAGGSWLGRGVED